VYAVTGDNNTFDSGPSGNAFLTVNTTTSAYAALPLQGSNPVTVTLTPHGTTAYIVDATHPRILGVPLPTTPGEKPSIVPLPT
jgi:hypothetical protein